MNKDTTPLSQRVCLREKVSCCSGSYCVLVLLSVLYKLDTIAWKKEGMTEVAGGMKRPGNMVAREKTFGGRTGLPSQMEGSN